ncbi:545_t:CDS:1, partial [Gigaspora margarita]
MKTKAQKQSEIVLIEERKDAKITKQRAEEDNAKNIKKLRSMHQREDACRSKD